MSRLAPEEFLNLNAPSWNSHQDPIVLVKITAPYQVSVSFSTSNDMRLTCGADIEAIDNAPDSYAALAELVDDVRGERQRRPLLGRIKASIANYFLYTSILYTNIRNRWPEWAELAPPRPRWSPTRPARIGWCGRSWQARITCG